MTSLTSVNFHGIGEPERALEPNESPYWVSKEQFEYVLDQITASPDPTAITITFDDGNVSDHDIALPALVARGLSARFFVLTGRLEQAGSLHREHLHNLRDAGMVIGSHGIDHVSWPALDDTALGQELRASRVQLEDICDHPVTEAGIPFGRYDARVLRALRAAGYACAWSSDCGQWRQGAFVRPRTSVRHNMPPDDVQAILSGRMPALRRMRRAIGMTRRRWTVTG